MQPEIRQAGETAPESNINEEASTLAKLPPAEQSANPRVREISRQIVLLLERAGEAFNQYKPAIIVIGLALAVMPLLAFTVALLAVIDALPLLAPALKLVGFGSTAWFVYRYLLFAPNRQELSQELEGLKEQVLGTENSPLNTEVKRSDDYSTSSSDSDSQSSREPAPEPDSELPESNSEPAPEPDPETPGSDPS